MYCLRSNIKQLSTFSRSALLGNVESLPCSVRFYNDKRLIRKPLKKFKPTTSMRELEEYEDEELYQSKLNQARAVTGKSFELITPRTRKSDSKIVASSTKKIEQVAPSEDDGEDEKDFWPQGFDRSTLPKFEKVLGWDKENPLLKKLKKKFSVAFNPSKASGEDLVIFEGKRLIIEALQTGIEPETFVFSRVNLLTEFPLDKLQNCDVVQIPYKNIAVWSELTTSPGFMATFRRSDIEEISGLSLDSLPIHLILDNIRNPDNMGALLRVAAGVGCKQVILMHGCSNPWNPKTLRSAAGAHLKVPIKSNVTWDVIHKVIPQHTQVAVADLVLSSFDGKGKVVTSKVAETLKDLESKSKQFRYQDAASQDGGFRDYSYFEKDLLDEYKNLPLPTVTYDQFEVSSSLPENDSTENNFGLVILIGGETHGVSAEAFKFAHSHFGEKIYIPLRNSIESLNAASAASVIMFEIQKKIISSQNDKFK